MSCRHRLEFPSDEYPPNEESKDLIVRAITTAAAEVDIHLVIRATQMKEGASLASISFVLQTAKICNYDSEECLQRYGLQRTVYQ